MTIFSVGKSMVNLVNLYGIDGYVGNTLKSNRVMPIKIVNVNCLWLSFCSLDVNNPLLAI